MTQFAPVANLQTYWELLLREQLGSYHLLIATEIAKNPTAWSEFWSYPNIPEGLGKDMFIILDNGLIEAGAATDPQTLREAADAVDANCIVLPDVLGDGPKTIKVASAALPEMKQTGYPLMGVVQGRNWDEIHLILDFYNRMEVQYLSIPRVMVELFGTRVKLITRARGFGLPIHLLGFSDNLYDDILSAKQPGVMGIDSAVPLWYPGVLPPTPPVNADFGRRPKDYWSTVPSESVGYQNVERVREWLRVLPVQAAHTEAEQPATEETPTLPFA